MQNNNVVCILIITKVILVNAKHTCKMKEVNMKRDYMGIAIILFMVFAFSFPVLQAEPVLVENDTGIITLDNDNTTLILDSNIYINSIDNADIALLEMEFIDISAPYLSGSTRPNNENNIFFDSWESDENYKVNGYNDWKVWQFQRPHMIC